MNTNPLLKIALIFLGATTISACGPQKKPVVSPIEKSLEQAEKDARSGQEDKAVQEIDDAEKALIAEDKKMPATQNFRSVSGEDVKAKAEADALKELEHAKRDARGKLAGDAADEIKRAIQDVEVKEAK